MVLNDKVSEFSTKKLYQEKSSLQFRQFTSVLLCSGGILRTFLKLKNYSTILHLINLVSPRLLEAAL